MKFKIGDKVKFIEDWCIFPEDSISKGETGVITEINFELIAVRLDKKHDGLDTWDNEAHIYLADKERKPEDYIKTIGRTEDFWYKKYGLMKTPVDFELHLDENDVKDHEKLVENVRFITIDNCNVEFGFEKEGNKVNIQFGYGVLKIDEETFEEALKRYRLRTKEIQEMKKNGC